jgi:predicted nucleotidyltransferase
MTDPLVDAFDMFDRRIQPTDAQIRLAMGRGQRLSQLLSRNSQIFECRVVGSIVRSTAIRIFSDVDILAVFNLPGCPEMADSRELLTLAKSILGHHMQTMICNDNTISLRFSKWPNVDVLPAMATGRSGANGTLRIPTRSGTWQYYSPGNDDQLVVDAVLRLGQGFRSVVRIFKWWNKLSNEVMSSFEVERLAREVFAQGLPDCPRAIQMLFAAITQDQDGMSVSHSRYAGSVISSESSDIVRRACDLAAQAQQATAIADFRGASLLWRRLLGDRFPFVVS